MKLSKRGIANRRGVAAVETAIVLVIAVILTFAIYDYSRYFMLSQLVNNAAREGARQAVVNTNTQNTATIQNTVVQYLAGQNYYRILPATPSVLPTSWLPRLTRQRACQRLPTATGTTRLLGRPSWSRSMPSLLPFSRHLGFCQRP